MGNCTCVDGRTSLKSHELEQARTPNNPSLIAFYRDNAKHMNRDVQKIFESVLNGKEITEVSILSGKITSIDTAALLKLLCVNKRVKEIVFVENSLSIEDLLDILANCRLGNIQKLGVVSNNLNNERLSKLVESLEKMHSLKELDLSSNKFSNVDALCRVLPEITKLRTLNVRGNPIHTRGLKKLARALKGHIEMREFKMDSIDLSQDDVAEIRAILPLAALV